MKKCLLLLFLSFGLWACSHNAELPKPYGYCRLSIPDTSYVPFGQGYTVDSSFALNVYPFDFQLSRNAVVEPREQEGKCWLNIHYPDLNADIHCTYKPVQSNLRELTDDALEFVYKHASYATSIPEQSFAHPEVNVYGVLIDLKGNTASPCQFFLTDSTHHFFRASVYCNCRPNADSLAPVIDYLRLDVQRIMESFSWKY